MQTTDRRLEWLNKGYSEERTIFYKFHEVVNSYQPSIYHNFEVDFLVKEGVFLGEIRV